MELATSRIICADVTEGLRHLEPESVQCVVTSPPYWGLRDYGVGGQLGLEKTPEEYVAKMVEVFREIRRVLRKDGTVWLNLGDSYSGSGKGPEGNLNQGESFRHLEYRTGGVVPAGLKPKDLCGIPWSVAKALQQPYYTGKITNERDRVWLAAIIDGEGSICGFTHERKDGCGIRTGIHITITNSNVSLLDECFRIWPTSRKDHNPHGKGHKGGLDIWRWIPHNAHNKSQLLQELYPYLVAKRQQCLLAWNFLESSKKAKSLGGGGLSKIDNEQRRWIVQALSRLNHSEDIVLPNWVKEPPALYELGWYLRSDIIWSKPNPMPESVRDRPTRAHEYLFLLTKSAKYYYDQNAIREQGAGRFKEQSYHDPNNPKYNSIPAERYKHQFDGRVWGNPRGRNRRTVWEIPTQPYPEAHFATFPEKLVEPCIKAGTSEKGCCPKCKTAWQRQTKQSRTFQSGSGRSGNPISGKQQPVQGAGYGDIKLGPTIETKTLGWHPQCKCRLEPIPCTVLDPFCGSGTTGLVALKLKRSFIGIELNPEYCELANDRIRKAEICVSTQEIKTGQIPLFE